MGFGMNIYIFFFKYIFGLTKLQRILGWERYVVCTYIIEIEKDRTKCVESNFPPKQWGTKCPVDDMEKFDV